LSKKNFLDFKSPLFALGLDKNFDVVAKVSGGGLTGQAESILW